MFFDIFYDFNKNSDRKDTIMNLEKVLNNPIFFERNRVWRVYKGGLLFSDFFGEPTEDSFYPEEWVCSCVTAFNEDSDAPQEGVSIVKGTDIPFTELLEKYKTELLGDRDELGILVKMLDSAIRLPVQCHPDKAYSRKHFNSEHGKAESWVILDTREDACIYFGFKDSITKEEFSKAVDASEHDPEAMSCLLNRIPVKKGDVFFIDANMIHAIGAGCFLLETQEPTDFTIQPEHWCGTVKLNDSQMYLGLDRSTALDCFNYGVHGEDAIAMGRKLPRVICDDGHVKAEILIGYDDTPCFAVKRLTLDNGGHIENTECPAIYVVTDGEGKICCPDGTTDIKKGDYFFMPACLDGKFSLASDTHIEIVACLPPKQ